MRRYYAYTSQKGEAVEEVLKQLLGKTRKCTHTGMDMMMAPRVKSYLAYMFPEFDDTLQALDMILEYASYIFLYPTFDTYIFA